MSRRTVVALFGLLLAIGLVVAPGFAQTPKPLKLRFAAAGLGSAYYVYAAAIADLLKPHLPPGSTVDILPSPGGVANTILVGDGRAEIGLTPSPSVRWALEGTVSFKGKQEGIRGIYGDMDEFYVATIVTKKSGIRSLEEIKEKKFPLRLMTVPVGGNGEIAARHILEAYGMSYDMLKSWGGLGHAHLPDGHHRRAEGWPRGRLHPYGGAGAPRRDGDRRLHRGAFPAPERRRDHPTRREVWLHSGQDRGERFQDPGL